MNYTHKDMHSLHSQHNNYAKGVESIQSLVLRVSLCASIVCDGRNASYPLSTISTIAASMAAQGRNRDRDKATPVIMNHYFNYVVISVSCLVSRSLIIRKPHCLNIPDSKL